MLAGSLNAAQFGVQNYRFRISLEITILFPCPQRSNVTKHEMSIYTSRHAITEPYIRQLTFLRQ